MCRQKTMKGYTLIELMVVVCIISTLSLIALPSMTAYLYKTKLAAAISDIRTLEREINVYMIEHDALPETLAQIQRDTLKDPWGKPYQYRRLTEGKGKKGKGGIAGIARKNKFLVPLNSDFDLYSMGRDRKSKLPLTAKDSHDDVLRAYDGSFVGLASLI